MADKILHQSVRKSQPKKQKSKSNPSSKRKISNDTKKAILPSTTLLDRRKACESTIRSSARLGTKKNLVKSVSYRQKFAFSQRRPRLKCLRTCKSAEVKQEPSCEEPRASLQNPGEKTKLKDCQKKKLPRCVAFCHTKKLQPKKHGLEILNCAAISTKLQPSKVRTTPVFGTSRGSSDLFFLPVKSCHSLRRIIPNKRFFDEGDVCAPVLVKRSRLPGMQDSCLLPKLDQTASVTGRKSLLDKTGCSLLCESVTTVADSTVIENLIKEIPVTERQLSDSADDSQLAEQALSNCRSTETLKVHLAESQMTTEIITIGSGTAVFTVKEFQVNESQEIESQPNNSGLTEPQVTIMSQNVVTKSLVSDPKLTGTSVTGSHMTKLLLTECLNVDDQVKESLVMESCVLESQAPLMVVADCRQTDANCEQIRTLSTDSVGVVSTGNSFSFSSSLPCSTTIADIPSSKSTILQKPRFLLAQSLQHQMQKEETNLKFTSSGVQAQFAGFLPLSSAQSFSSNLSPSLKSFPAAEESRIFGETQFSIGSLHFIVRCR